MNEPENLDFSNLSNAFSAKSDYQLKRANLLFSVINSPFLSSLGTFITKFAFSLRLPINGLIRSTVFAQFCGGESIEKSRETINELSEFGIKAILDYSAEGENTEEGYDLTMLEIIRVIDAAREDADIPFSVFKMSGMASAKALEKVSNGQELTDLEEESLKKTKSRVLKVCQYAFDCDVPIMIDAEETWIQPAIDAIVYDMMERFNKKSSIVSNTFQMYRSDALDLLKKGIEMAREKNHRFGAKLVRGAYMEKERDRAKDEGRKSPIHVTKKDTDDCFDSGLKLCIENKDTVSLMCASHNEKSNMLLASLLKEHNIRSDNDSFWFAQLYGMSDNISFNLSKAGYNVAKYVPYGPIKLVMPYLFRRVSENTSVAGQSSRELTMIRQEIKRRRKTA